MALHEHSIKLSSLKNDWLSLVFVIIIIIIIIIIMMMMLMMMMMMIMMMIRLSLFVGMYGQQINSYQ